jgi:putative uncharacterized protein (fragment)
MQQMELTKEEQQKLRELWRSPKFKKARKAMKRSFYYKDNPMVPFFVLFSGLLFLCVFVLPILITLKEQSILSPDTFLFYQKIVFGIVIASFLGIICAFILAVICSLIFKIIKLPETEETYLNRILPPMVRIILPKAEFDGNNNLPLNAFKKAVPIFSYYYPAGLLDFQEQPELKITDLYAYSPQKGKDRKGLYEFYGQIYTLQYHSHFEGQLRIVPTEKVWGKETNGGHFPACDGEKKIDVEDITHNEHYNIFCTDEQAARKFLTPTMISWFDRQISSGLGFSLNDDRIYLIVKSDLALFTPPKNKKAWKKWNMEKTARSIKTVVASARELAEMF